MRLKQFIQEQALPKWAKIKSCTKLFHYALDELGDSEITELDRELQGLHIEDKADHPEAMQIITDFLIKHKID